MAKIGVEIQIDVMKIDKSRLYHSKKTGAKYLTMTAFIDIDEKDQYDNNGFISEKQTKEESDSKTYTTILGNCKVFWSNAPVPAMPEQPQATANPPAIPAHEFDDIPF